MRRTAQSIPKHPADARESVRWVPGIIEFWGGQPPEEIYSCFHMPSQKGRDGLGQLVLRVAGGDARCVAHEEDQSQQVSLR